MRTAEAVTPMPWLAAPLIAISMLYLLLGTMVLFLLRRQVFESPRVPALVPGSIPGGEDGRASA
jgi:hypothetical protein